MHPAWERVIEQPQPHGHLVQIYDQRREDSLIRNATRYFAEGLRKGEGLLVIARARQHEAFRKQTEGCEQAIREGRAAFFDSREMLGRLITGGRLEWSRFESVVGTALETVRPRGDDPPGVRAYGDIVDILWNARQYSVAIRLEQFWNKLRTRSRLSLFCGYSMDIFAADLHLLPLDGVLSSHSHLVPAESDAALEIAIDRAMEEVLGGEAATLRPLIRASCRPCWAVMPTGNRVALWRRKNLPGRSEEILRLAQRHYQALSAQ